MPLPLQGMAEPRYPSLSHPKSSAQGARLGQRLDRRLGFDRWLGLGGRVVAARHREENRLLPEPMEIDREVQATQLGAGAGLAKQLDGGATGVAQHP